MDDGLVLALALAVDAVLRVLILIVVDDGLVRVNCSSFLVAVLKSLNPYCSGRWSRTHLKIRIMKDFKMRLNPYCSGRWSRTYI